MRDPHLENRERAGVVTNEKVLGNFLIARISLIGTLARWGCYLRYDTCLCGHLQW